MNEHVHPIMREAMVPMAPMVIEHTHSADLPRAKIQATADLSIGDDRLVSIEGWVWVYRQDGRIAIDDIEIEVVGSNRLVRTIGIGAHFDTMRFRPLTPAEMQEHLCACAFHDLIGDPRFIDKAEVVLVEAERVWRQG